MNLCIMQGTRESARINSYIRGMFMYKRSSIQPRCTKLIPDDQTKHKYSLASVLLKTDLGQHVKTFYITY